MTAIAFAVGFIFGVVGTVAYNRFFPAKVAKASKELGEEIDRIRDRL